MKLFSLLRLVSEMDEMILHCNQNTVYVLNTSYSSYGVSFALNIHLHSLVIW